MTLQKGFVNELKDAVQRVRTGSAANELLDSILGRIDQNFDSPLSLFASATPDALLNIAANQVELGNGRLKSSAPSEDVINSYVATTINFQTASVSGGSVLTDGAAFALPTSTIGQFRRCVFVYRSDDNVIDTHFSAEAASVGALDNPGILFAEIQGTPVGYIDLEATAANAFKTAGSATAIIENKVGSTSTIYVFGGGASTGSVASDNINYATDGQFKSGVKNWAAYADAAATSPVDGTGGSPTVTFARSTSSPLQGTASGLFTKDAADRQGEGVAYTMTVDPFMKGRSLSVQFDFEMSANYAGSDVGVFLYDVTNSVLISPKILQGGSDGGIASGSGRFNGSFLLTQSTSYRLIFHVASTNAAAYTMKLDNLRIGEFSVQAGPGIGDWKSYTPIFLGLGAGDGTVTGQYREIGDSIEVMIGWIKDGTPGSGTTGVTWSIPSQYTINTTKLTSGLNTFLGANIGHAFTQPSNNSQGLVYPFSATTVSVTESGALTPVSGGDIPAGAIISLAFTVPVNELSSNVQLANRALEEFASNSGMGDANDTTSFVQGAQGSLLPTVAYTASRDKTVRFQTPVYATDMLSVEIFDASRNTWIPLEGFLLALAVEPFNIQNTNDYGVGLYAGTVANEVIVRFAQYAYASGATYGAAGEAWPASGDTADRWRVRKVSAGSVVGFVNPDPSIGNVRASEGAGTTTLYNHDNRHQIFNLSASRDCVIDSTNIVKGSTWTLENIGAFDLVVKASGGQALTLANSANIDATIRVGRVIIEALQDSPTTAAHWRVAYVQETLIHDTTYNDQAGVGDRTLRLTCSRKNKQVTFQHEVLAAAMDVRDNTRTRFLCNSNTPPIRLRPVSDTMTFVNNRINGTGGQISVFVFESGGSLSLYYAPNQTSLYPDDPTTVWPHTFTASCVTP